MIPNNYFKFVVIIVVLCGFSPAAFAQVTTPEEYLGYKPGENFRLATYEQLLGYFELIEGQSDRLKLFDMGPTSEDRRMKYAIISSRENMADLDRYKDISKTLSLAKNLTGEEAKKLASRGKVIVWIDAGIHASETSPQMHHFQLAYDLITGTDQQSQFIRDNVILLLVHANPDGMTIVADWYNQNVGTPYEVSRLPVLYHKYAGHDNNRDSFMGNLVETRNMNRIVGKEWFPELLYVQHEAAPFPARIWIPPNPEPVNPNIHPIIFRWKNLIGSAMGQGFEAADLPGAISRTAFDLWYPGYADGPSVEGHNIPSILTETANYRYATPRYYTINDFPEQYRDLTMGTFYPSPWKGGWWRFRDAVEYNLIASKSVLDIAAKYRYEFLYYKYKMAKDVIARFNNEPPYGWIIPAEQRDPNSTALMLNRLIDYGIEVNKADESFVYNGIRYPEGAYIIPTGQPFGMYVKNILEKQEYPDLRKYGHLWQGISRSLKWDGAPLAPYDGVGWTLPLQMGIKTHKMDTRQNIKSTSIPEAASPAGRITGKGPQLFFSHTDNNSFLALNQILNENGKVSLALSDFSIGSNKYPKGTFMVETGTLSSAALNSIVSESRIQLAGGDPGVKSKSLIKAKIGLYKSWVANMDRGWISYILEKYQFSYLSIADGEVKAGDLYDRFDVIILPDQSPSSIINGHRKGTMPPNYTGGITSDGVENLKDFVINGGVLICNKSSCLLPMEQFLLPVKNILEKVKSDSFNCPGSLLKTDYDTDHPLAFGMKKRDIAYFSRALVFEVLPDSLRKGKKVKDLPTKIIAKYPDESLLKSGWILGEDVIKDKAAIVEVQLGKGKIILFGFNVHNRAQAYTTFKLLFNGLYL